MCLKQMSLVDYERELDKAPFRTIDLFHSMIQTVQKYLQNTN